ncbi:MAG: hypothetical protein IMX03_08410 [Brockia lithotrophica]|nr:hypothetical protein [Brockia lithotrophica]
MPSAIAHSQNGWYVTAGSYSASKSAKASGNSGGKTAYSIGAGLSASAVEAGYIGKNYTAGVSVLSASGGASLSKRGVAIGGEAILTKYSGSYTFNAFGRTFTVDGSIGIGFGASASIGRRTGFSYYDGIGAGLWIDVRR